MIGTCVQQTSDGLTINFTVKNIKIRPCRDPLYHFGQVRPQ
jgi:hypothetical protein